MTEDEEREEWMNAPLGKPVIVNEAVVDLIVRINHLEEELDKLTDVVKSMSDHLIKVSDAAKEFKDAQI